MYGAHLLVAVLLVATGPAVLASDTSSLFSYTFLNVALKYRSDELYQLAIEEVEEAYKAKNLDEIYFTWDCEPFPSASLPQTVHELTPPDIGAIAAMGDSITAGNGISDATLVNVAIEKRGESWSVGRDKNIDEVVTIANILNEYNPDIQGGSTGEGPRWLRWSRYNVAEPGAKANDMFEQANMLVERMGEDDDVYNNQWKMITLFIGGNDICDQCNHRDTYTGRHYANHVRKGLDILHANVPKAFVNVVPIIDITPLRYMSRGPMCDYMQREFCACVVDLETMNETRPIQLEYFHALDTLVSSGRYDTRDDFTVVMQPMWVNEEFPQDEEGNYDDSWVSADCFHPNRKTHQYMAVSMWNTLFIEEGEKPYEYEGAEPIDYYCPTQGETFKTSFNSGSKLSTEEKVAKVAKGIHNKASKHN